MYRIDQLEDALVSAIITAGFTAKPYTNEPDAKFISTETGETPLALVTYHHCEVAKTATFQLRNGVDFHFHLYVAARNLRSLSASAATRGTGGNGLYAALDGLRALLAGNRLGLTAQPLLFISETPIHRSAGLSAYRQEWKITVME